MPLFEYVCVDCSAVLEVFQQPGDPSPRLCGYRCKLSGADERRGFGSLQRQLSAHAGSVTPVLRRGATDADIERVGFSKYANEGGKLVKIAGRGPDVIPTDEEP